MPRAVFNDVVIAQSDDIVTVDGFVYFPEAAVKAELLRDSSTRTRCGWKGEASYFHVEADGKIGRDAAWCYRDPKPAAALVRGRIAFWKLVHVMP